MVLTVRLFHHWGNLLWDVVNSLSLESSKWKPGVFLNTALRLKTEVMGLIQGWVSAAQFCGLYFAGDQTRYHTIPVPSGLNIYDANSPLAHSHLWMSWAQGFGDGTLGTPWHQKGERYDLSWCCISVIPKMPLFCWRAVHRSIIP